MQITTLKFEEIFFFLVDKNIIKNFLSSSGKAPHLFSSALKLSSLQTPQKTHNNIHSSTLVFLDVLLFSYTWN